MDGHVAAGQPAVAELLLAELAAKGIRSDEARTTSGGSKGHPMPR